MKVRLFYIMVFCFAVNLTFAQTSTLSIASETEPFIFYLNSKEVNPMANQVAVAPVNVGKNHVRLSFTKKGIPELNAQIDVPNDGQFHQLSYKIVPVAKGPYSLALISDVILGQNQTTTIAKKTDVQRSTDVKSNPGPSNKGNSNSRNITTGGSSRNTTATPGTESINVNVSAMENGMNTSINASGTPGANNSNAQISISMNVTEMSMNPSDNTGTPQVNPYAGRVPQVANGLACSSPSVNSQAFMQLKYKISQVYLDMTKAKEAKDFINNNCMTSAQVADLVKLLQMADTQLDVAQFGFMHTYDQAKYQIVVDAQMADYNKEKLLSFIGSYDGSTTITHTTQTTTSASDSHTVNYSVTMNVPQTATPVETNTTTTSSTSHQSYSTACSPMDADEFKETLEAADEPINEDKKMETVKSIFDDKCLNTNQVASILDLFINEDRKLDVAKWAFSRTADKDKYFRINKAFINEDRKTALSQFVKEH